jgi:DNA segregation ATPase FtsK/SpoIIIE, S-DNA-T family
MAKKKEQSTKEKSRKPTSEKTRLRRAGDQELQALKHEALGITVVAMSLALMLALCSFEPLTASLEANAQSNLIGPVGAYVADTVFKLLGIMAYLIPLALAFPGFCLLFAKPMELRLSVGFGFPTLILFGSTLAHLYLAPRVLNGYPAGGIVGGHTAEILQAFLGIWGSLILLYSLLITTFVVTTKLSIRGLFNDFGAPLIRNWGEAMSSLIERMSRGVPALAHSSGSLLVRGAHAFKPGRAKSVDEAGDHDAAPVTNRLDPAPSAPVVQKSRKQLQVSDSQIVETVDSEPTGSTPMMTTSKSPVLVDASDASVHQAEVSIPAAEQRLPTEKPIVNRRKSNSQPAEQIEIPLPTPGACAEYRLPPLHFLDYDDTNQVEPDPEFLQAQALRLMEALQTFKIEGRVTEIHPGPVVTMYEFEPAPGVRISKIAGLADDLAMALKAVKVRIVAPIPGKGVVGFEVPNAEREMVWIKEIIGSKPFNNKKHSLPMALGKDIHGEPVITDLAKMPHLLVAGTTGSGKSVGVNGMITSLLYRMTPEEVRFIMVDPKMLELSIYEGIPHLLLPVVTDAKKASLALRWAVDEMERRYGLMKDAGVRDIRGFNRKQEKNEAEHEASILRAQAEAIERAVSTQDDSTAVDTVAHTAVKPEASEHDKLPYIVVVIDEFADLMMVAGKEVEYCVARIAQKARAAGIHLILATQRPSTDVITGVIKANFPTRMAFQVSSAIDSRTILSTNGAESLLGKGDMLFMPPGTSKLTRIHGAFLSEEEIHEVVQFIGSQMEPNYLDESILEAPDESADESDSSSDDDPMYEEAVRVVARDSRASTSHLQRRLSLGYNRAARMVDQMERDGLVGPSRGAKPREVNKQLLHELVSRWDAA